MALPADAAPCQRPAQARPAHSSPLSPPADASSTSPGALPKAPHTPWGQFSLPKPCLSPQSISDPPGHRTASVGCGLQPSQRGDATSLPSHAAGGLCSRAGPASGRQKQTRGGSACPHASTAHGPGRANKSAPCAGRAAWACVPASLLLQAAHPLASHQHGTWARQGGQGGVGGANWQGSALHLCQATATPAQKLPGVVGSQAAVGFQFWWDLSGGGNPVVVVSKLWRAPSSAGGLSGGCSQPGKCHKAHPAGPARNLLPPQPLPKPGSLSRRQDSHPAWQGWAEHQPASPGRQYWKRLGKGSIGPRLAAGRQAAKELSVPLLLPQVSSATVKPGFEGRGEGCVPPALPLHNPPG